MARETKAERLAREAAELEKRVELAKSTYTERMMAVLERATKMNFEIEVKDAKFVLSDRDNRYTTFYVLPAWTEFADTSLWELEYHVEDKEAEAERRANLRKEALSKLSEEEREVLGL
jgi:hypothetical protein